MPDTPATNVETAGVYGHAGAIPVGSQAVSGAVKDTTEIGGAGSITARPENPGMSGTPDTEGVYGPNKPESFSPVSTLMSATKDTTQGYAANMSAPVYRAPGSGSPGVIKDTTNAYGFVAAVPVDSYPWITQGTIETGTFGAPGGLVSSQTDTITADVGVPVPLTKSGILSTPAQLVVKKGVTTLVVTTDYTVVTTGTAQTRTYSITAVDSVTVNDGDSLTVQYLYGDASYFASHDPTAVPPAPVIGTAVAGDRRIRVVWTNPALAQTDDIDGYLIQSDTEGTRYVPGGLLAFDFENVVPGQSYTFRVAAFNEKGLSVFSAWSNAVVPLNYDQVPTGALDPDNTGNPVYNADGTIVAGTGLWI
jgi:hypothetical protein